MTEPATAWKVSQLRVDGIELEFAEADGERTPVIYLHGLGSDWRDFEAAVRSPTLSEHRLIAPNLPGHGRSMWVSNTGEVLVTVAELLEQLLEARRVSDFLLIGHSLGGALAVHLGRACGPAVRGLVSVEGNLVAADCGILSTRTLEWGATLPSDAFFDALNAYLSSVDLPGYAEFRAGYSEKLSSRAAWQAYTGALVHSSRGNRLLTRFLALTCKRAYVYGAIVEPPPLKALRKAGIRTCAIPRSTHWPMYTNPAGYIDVLGQLVVDFDDGRR